MVMTAEEVIMMVNMVMLTIVPKKQDCINPKTEHNSQTWCQAEEKAFVMVNSVIALRYFPAQLIRKICLKTRETGESDLISNSTS